MKYLHFGRRTGLRVSELALGTGNFGTGWGYGSERDEAKEVFDGYVDAGGNFIDTANGYQGGQAEQLVGDFIAADRDYFVLATKYTLGLLSADGVSRTGNNRKNLVRRAPTCWRSCAAGRRWPAFRWNTAWPNAARTVSCCRWRKPWAWVRPSGRRWAAAS